MSGEVGGNLGKRWVPLVLFGLVGQLAWTIENMYFNVFLYKTVTYDPLAVAIMVGASAVVATGTTLVMGSASDALGRRRPFIVGGYLIWGLTIMAFALVGNQTSAELFPGADAVAVTVAIVVVLDCVMTFFGSTANDSAFNAWVTDNTTAANRGRAEGVLNALALVAMIVVFGALDPLTQAGQWTTFFLVVGGIVSLCGLSGLWLVRDAPGVQRNQEHAFTRLAQGLRISAVKENPALYVVFAGLALAGIAQQVYMPYLLIYIQYHLGVESYAVPLALTLVLAAAVSILGGRLADRIGKVRFLVPAVGALFLGLVLVWIQGILMGGSGAVAGWTLIPVATLMLGGMLTLNTVLGATARDLMPDTERGYLNGVRLIFMVLIPMVTGPFIGSAIIRGGPQYFDEYGVRQWIPGPGIFLGAAAVSLLCLLPALWLRRRAAAGGARSTGGSTI
ncbi:MAG: MFS transporter [Propionibacteriaceae bacterium]|jgi:MFS family permease|nr:MFS transporter [Propionibacteriaceae bacterium]